MKFNQFDRKRVSTRISRYRTLPLTHKPILELLEDRRMLAAVAWTGTGDGESWHDAANWSGAAVPTADDDVTIDVVSDPLIKIAGRTANAKTLSASERIELSTTLRVANQAQVSDISFNRARLEVELLSIRGKGTFEISTIDVSTRATFEETSSFVFTSSANVLRGEFVNFGTLEFSNSIVRASDSSITNEKSAEMIFQDSRFQSGSLTNQGRIVSNGETRLANTFDDQGELDFQSGTLSLFHGSSKSGIEVPKESELQIGGDFTFTGDVGVVGGGSVSLTSRFQDFGQSIFRVDGNVSISSNASVNFDSDVEFSSLNVDRGSITGAGSLSIRGDSSFNLARSIDIGGSITVHDQLTIQSSNILAQGGIRVEPNASVEIINFETNLGPHTENHGSIQLGNTVWKLGADLVNASGGKLLGDGTIVGDVTNAGGLVAPGTSETGNTIRIQGNYTQDVGGTLEANLFGSDSAENDLLSVTKTATVNGTISVVLADAFRPAAGATFTAMEAGTLTQAISETKSNVPSVPFQSQVNENALQLVVGTIEPAGQVAEIRRLFNDALAAQKAILPNLSAALDVASGAFPFLPPDVDSLTNALGVGPAIANLAATAMPLVEAAVTEIEDLRAQFEQLGYTVECVFTDSACGEDLIRVRSVSSKQLPPTTFDVNAWLGNPLASLTGDASATGISTVRGDIAADLVIGIDDLGFYMASDSAVRTSIDLDSNLAGTVGPFSLAAAGQLVLNPVIGFAAMDRNDDGRIRIEEFDPTRLTPELGDVNGDITVELEMPTLDFVDAIATQPNTTNGGDPFRIVASGSVQANLGRMNETSLQRISASWSDIEIANPDVDGDGTPDFTSDVLTENLRLFAVNQLRGSSSQLTSRIAAVSNQLDLPGTSAPVGEIIRLQTSLADFIEEDLTVSVIEFDQLETWINTGELPSETELVGLTMDLGTVSLLPEDGLRLNLIPQAHVSYDEASLTGQISIGVDFSGDGPYLRTGSDDGTRFAGTLALSATTEDDIHVANDLLLIESPVASIRTGFEVSFNGGEDGKLPLSELLQFGAINVAISGEPVLELQADGASSNLRGSTVAFVDDDANDDLPAVKGTYNFESGEFVLDLRKMELRLRGFLEADALPAGATPAVQLLFDPQAQPNDPLFTIESLQATAPQFTSNGLTPTATVSNFGIRHDGTPFIGSASLEVPAGYRFGAGLAGFLPVEIRRIDLQYPDPSDIDQFDVIVAGTVLVEEIDGQLDALSQTDVETTLQIGNAPVNAGDFAALLSVESLAAGKIEAKAIGRLVEVGTGTDRRTTVQAEPITVGLSNFSIAEGLTLDGELSLAPTADGMLGSEVTGHFNVLAVDSSLASDDFVGLRIDVLPGSSVTVDDEGMTFDIDGRLQLDADFAGTLGGIGVSGGAVRFSLLIETSNLDAAPFVQFDSFNASVSSVTAEKIEIRLGDLLTITGSDIAIVDKPGPGEPIGSINQATIEVNAFGGWASDPVTAEDIQIFEDRIEFNSLSTELNGALSLNGSPLASFEGLHISLDGLTVNVGTNLLHGGSFSANELDVNLDAIVISAEEAKFLDEVATVSGITANIATNDNQPFSIKLTAERFDAVIEDVVQLSSDDVSISLTNDMTADVLTVGSVSGIIPALTGEGKTFSVQGGLAVKRDGSLRFLSDVVKAELDVGQIADRFSVADLLPLTVETAEIRFNDAKNDLTNFDLVLTDVSLAQPFVDSLPFEPVLLVGDPNETEASRREFDLTVAISSLGAGTPQSLLKDVEQVTLGFRDWDVGEVVFDGEITLAGLDTNAIPEVSGFISFDFESAGSSVQPAAPLTVNGGKIQLDGSYTPATSSEGAGIEIGIDAELDFELMLGELMTLKDVGLTTTLNLNFESPGDLIPNVAFSLDEVSVGLFEMNFGELMKFEAPDATFNFSAEGEEPVVEFPSLEVSFPVLAGDENDENAPGGSVSNLKIMPGGLFTLGGFKITKGELLDDVMQWVPVSVTDMGLAFGDDFFGTNESGQQTVNDPTDIAFSLSGEVDSLSLGEGDSAISLPLIGDFQDLTVDIGKLLNGDFPITNIDSFTVGLEPIELTDDFTIGGAISLGLVEVTEGGTTRKSLFGSLDGTFDTPMFGGTASLTLTEIGPLSGRLTVPVAVPLGPSGLILKDIGGGFRFGGELIPSVESPAELVETNTFVESLDFGSSESPETELQQYLDDGIDYTWKLPFTVGMQATVDSVLTPGVFQGDLSIGANFGVTSNSESAEHDKPPAPSLKLLATGEITVYGLPFGRAGLLIDFDPESGNVLEPKLDFAFRAPAPGNPLGFLLPAEVVFEGSLHTDGMIESPLVAIQHFLNVAVTELRDGVANSEFSISTSVLNAMAGRMTPNSPLIKILYGDDLPDEISGQELGEKIISELPATFYGTGISVLPDDVRLATLVFRDALLSLADIDHGDGGVQASSNEFFTILREAVNRAGSAALDVFNPTLQISGALQPTIFGFPLGDATDEVSLTMSKDRLEVGLVTSIKESLKRSATLFGTGIAGGFTELLVGGPGFTDELAVDFSLNFPDELVATIFDGERTDVELLDSFVDTINPFAAWEANVSGAIKFLGFDIAKVSGILFAPAENGDTASFLANNVHSVGLDDTVYLTEENTGVPNDETCGKCIPVFRQSQYDAMSSLGGILLTGELNVPSILQDPAAVFTEIASTPLPDLGEQFDTILDGQIDLEDLNAATEVKDDYQAYISSTIDKLTENSRAGAVQLFVPSPATLFDVDFFLDSDGSSNSDPIGDFSEQLVEILSSAYLEGFVDLKLMSIDIGGAQIQGALDELTVRTHNDLLGGLDAEISLGSNDIPISTVVSSVLSNPLVANVFQSLNLPSNLQLDPATLVDFVERLTGEEFPLPTAQMSVQLGTDTLFSEMSLPEFLVPSVPADVTANATFEIYSPSLVKADDDLQRFGGARFEAELNMPGLVDEAGFVFEFETPFVDIEAFDYPEFVAHAQADRIGLPTPDLIEINDVQLRLASEDSNLTLDVNGELEILGDRFSSQVQGQLEVSSVAIAGDLLLESKIDFGPALKLDGQATVTIDSGAADFLEIAVTGSDGTGDASLKLFATESGLRPFGLDAEGQFFLLVENDDLVLEFDAAANMIVLNAPVATGTVAGKVNINDRITGIFDGELNVFPFGASQTHAELDAFGCFTFDSTGIPLTPLQIGNCGAALTVPEQISNRAPILPIELSEPAERNLNVTLQLSDGSPAPTTATAFIPASARSGFVTLPETFLAQITNKTLEQIDVTILIAEYESGGIDLFRPATPQFIPGAQPVQMKYPSIQVQMTTSILTEMVGDDLVGRVQENAEPIVVTFTATTDSPSFEGESVKLGWAEGFASTAKVSEDYDVSEDSVTFRIGQEVTLEISPIDDLQFEPHEEFALLWNVLESPAIDRTYLPARRFEITLEDNDPEMPSGALAFYSFDRTRFEIQTRQGTKTVDGCCFPELAATFVDEGVSASEFERGKFTRRVVNGNIGPPILSKDPAGTVPLGLEKHDPVFNSFSHGVAEATWTDSIDETSYFEFRISAEDNKTLAVSGIDFWERRVLENLPLDKLVGSPEVGFVNGPTRWGIRSSRDEFASVLSEGVTPSTQFSHHFAEFKTPFNIAPEQEVAFRIYGIEGRKDDFDSIPWIVDNVALVGASQSTIDSNSRPGAIDPPRVNVSHGTTTPIRIPLAGFDLETAASDLTFEITSPPAFGAIAIDGNEAVFTPPAGGLQGGVSFQFVAKDLGDSKQSNLKTSLPAIGEINTIAFPRPELKFVKGRVVKNYVTGGTVFFDANQNGVHDFVGDLREPSTMTAADGSYELFVSTDFDIDGDGQLTAADGQLVVQGGTIIGSQAPLNVSLSSDPQSATITPMTTLSSTFVSSLGLTGNAAEQLVADRFSNGLLLPGQTDPVKQVLEGNVIAKQAESASSALMLTVELAAAVIMPKEPASQRLRDTIITNFARLMVADELSVPFDSPTPFVTLLTDTAEETGLPLPERLTTVAAEAIAAINRQADRATLLDAKSSLDKLARVEKDAIEVVIPRLRSFALGETNLESVSSMLQDAGYASRLEATIVGPIQPVEVTVADATIVEGDGNNLPVDVVVRLSESSRSKITVRYETLAESATSSDFVSADGLLVFAPGETQKTIRIHIVADRETESTELLRVHLLDPQGAVIVDQYAAIEIRDNDAAVFERTTEFIDLAAAAIASQSNDSKFDFDRDGTLSENDFDVLVDDLLQVKRGDANLDGKVDFADFLLLAGSFGKQASWSSGNFDLNEFTDFADFLVLAQNFGFDANSGNEEAEEER